MALLPTDPKQQQALAAVAVSLVVLYAANSLWYSGAKQEVETQETRLETLQTQNRTAQTLAISAGQDVEEKMALFERHIAQLEQLIPGSEEVAAVVDEISVVAREVGVDVNLIRPEQAEPGLFYAKQFNITVHLVFQMKLSKEFKFKPSNFLPYSEWKILLALTVG